MATQTQAQKPTPQKPAPSWAAPYMPSPDKFNKIPPPTTTKPSTPSTPSTPPSSGGHHHSPTPAVPSTPSPAAAPVTNPFVNPIPTPSIPFVPSPGGTYVNPATGGGYSYGPGKAPPTYNYVGPPGTIPSPPTYHAPTPSPQPVGPTQQELDQQAYDRSVADAARRLADARSAFGSSSSAGQASIEAARLQLAAAQQGLEGSRAAFMQSRVRPGKEWTPTAGIQEKGRIKQFTGQMDQARTQLAGEEARVQGFEREFQSWRSSQSKRLKKAEKEIKAARTYKVPAMPAVSTTLTTESSGLEAAPPIKVTGYEPIANIPQIASGKWAYSPFETTKEIVTGFVDTKTGQSIPIQNLSQVQKDLLKKEGWTFNEKGSATFTSPISFLTSTEYNKQFKVLEVPEVPEVKVDLTKGEILAKDFIKQQEKLENQASQYLKYSGILGQSIAEKIPSYLTASALTYAAKEAAKLKPTYDFITGKVIPAVSSDIEKIYASRKVGEDIWQAKVEKPTVDFIKGELAPAFRRVQAIQEAPAKAVAKEIAPQFAPLIPPAIRAVQTYQQVQAIPSTLAAAGIVEAGKYVGPKLVRAGVNEITSTALEAKRTYDLFTTKVIPTTVAAAGLGIAASKVKQTLEDQYIRQPTYDFFNKKVIPTAIESALSKVITKTPSLYEQTVKDRYNEIKNKTNIKEDWGNFWKNKKLEGGDIIDRGAMDVNTKEVYLNKLWAILPASKSYVERHEIGHTLDPNIKDYNNKEEIAVREKYANDFQKFIKNPDKFRTQNPELTKQFEKDLGLSGLSDRIPSEKLLSGYLRSAVQKYREVKPTYEFITDKVIPPVIGIYKTKEALEQKYIKQPTYNFITGKVIPSATAYAERELINTGLKTYKTLRAEAAYGVLLAQPVIGALKMYQKGEKMKQEYIVQPTYDFITGKVIPAAAADIAKTYAARKSGDIIWQEKVEKPAIDIFKRELKVSLTNLKQDFKENIASSKEMLNRPEGINLLPPIGSTKLLPTFYPKEFGEYTTFPMAIYQEEKRYQLKKAGLPEQIIEPSSTAIDIGLLYTPARIPFTIAQGASVWGRTVTGKNVPSVAEYAATGLMATGALWSSLVPTRSPNFWSVDKTGALIPGYKITTKAGQIITKVPPPAYGTPLLFQPSITAPMLYHKPIIKAYSSVRDKLPRPASETKLTVKGQAAGFLSGSVESFVMTKIPLLGVAYGTQLLESAVTKPKETWTALKEQVTQRPGETLGFAVGGKLIERGLWELGAKAAGGVKFKVTTEEVKGIPGKTIVIISKKYGKLYWFDKPGISESEKLHIQTQLKLASRTVSGKPVRVVFTSATGKAIPLQKAGKGSGYTVQAITKFDRGYYEAPPAKVLQYLKESIGSGETPILQFYSGIEGGAQRDFFKALLEPGAKLGKKPQSMAYIRKGQYPSELPSWAKEATAAAWANGKPSAKTLAIINKLYKEWAKNPVEWKGKSVVGASKLDYLKGQLSSGAPDWRYKFYAAVKQANVKGQIVGGAEDLAKLSPYHGSMESQLVSEPGVPFYRRSLIDLRKAKEFTFKEKAIKFLTGYEGQAYTDVGGEKLGFEYVRSYPSKSRFHIEYKRVTDQKVIQNAKIDYSRVKLNSVATFRRGGYEYKVANLDGTFSVSRRITRTAWEAEQVAAEAKAATIPSTIKIETVADRSALPFREGYRADQVYTRPPSIFLTGSAIREEPTPSETTARTFDVRIERPEARLTESRVPEPYVPEPYVPEPYIPEPRPFEPRPPELRPPELRPPEPRPPEPRPREPRPNEPRIYLPRIRRPEPPRTRVPTLPTREDEDSERFKRARRRQKKYGAYIVTTRQAGKEVPVTYKGNKRVPLIRGEALYLGQQYVKETARASFRLRPVPIEPKTLGLPTITETQLLGLGFRAPIKRGVVQPLKDIFVQRRELRIVSPGEIREIPMAGATARKENKSKKNQRTGNFGLGSTSRKSSPLKISRGANFI